MRVFVTGFGPFGHVAENPSSYLAQNCGLPSAVLEVSYQAVNRFLESEFPKGEFDALLMLGVSGRAKGLSLEMFGANACAKHPDVLGVSGPRVIDPGGPAWRESTLWEQADYDLPGFARSRSAGRYLCNYSLYRALALHPSHRVGFLHVPTSEKVPLQSQLEKLKELVAALESR